MTAAAVFSFNQLEAPLVIVHIIFKLTLMTGEVKERQLKKYNIYHFGQNPSVNQKF